MDFAPIILSDYTGKLPEHRPAGTVVATLSVEGYDISELKFILWQQGAYLPDLAFETGDAMFALDGNKLITTAETDFGAFDNYGTNRFSYFVTVVAYSGTDTPVARSNAGLQVLDYLDVLKGTSKADSIRGDSGANQVNAGAGDDRINGLGGNDVLYGGNGHDVMAGANGDDRFLFKSINESKVSNPDTIIDWDGRADAPYYDTIDLNHIDANTKVAGNQDFEWIGRKEFSGKAGELRYEKTSSDTYIYADVDGNKKADFALHLNDATTLYKSEFLL